MRTLKSLGDLISPNKSSFKNLLWNLRLSITWFTCCHALFLQIWWTLNELKTSTIKSAKIDFIRFFHVFNDEIMRLTPDLSMHQVITISLTREDGCWSSGTRQQVFLTCLIKPNSLQNSPSWTFAECGPIEVLLARPWERSGTML